MEENETTLLSALYDAHTEARHLKAASLLPLTTATGIIEAINKAINLTLAAREEPLDAP